MVMEDHGLKTGEVAVLVVFVSFVLFKSLFLHGISQLYIKLLLHLFEFGKQEIEAVKKLKCVNPYEDNGLFNSDTNKIIIRRNNILLPEKKHTNNNNNNNNEILHNEKDEFVIFPTENENRIKFDLSSSFELIKTGIESIIEDQVTPVFQAEELKSWNFLTRTSNCYEFLSWKLTVIWIVGVFARYFILFPLRVIIFTFGLLFFTVSSVVVGCIPSEKIRRFVSHRFMVTSMDLVCCGVGVIAIYHGKSLSGCGICVSNHTTPLDALILMRDNYYSLIGQRLDGLFGYFQHFFIRVSPHVWFERFKADDRRVVTKRIKDHLSNPKNPPLLIFPEGTCINNTAVMQFKKGGFEVDDVVYPVAMKYDPMFSNAFWDSKKYSMLHYAFMVMSSWTVVCNIWYLPPMHRSPNETTVEFANRVKSAIAKRGGLVDLEWSGELKRSNVKKEWREFQQEEFTRRLKLK